MVLQQIRNINTFKVINMLFQEHTFEGYNKLFYELIFWSLLSLEASFIVEKESSEKEAIMDL